MAGRLATLHATLVALTLATSVATPVRAEGETAWLGLGHILTNDNMGDGSDRWRTGSFQLSAVRGPLWDGTLPQAFGQVLEFRLRTDIITPARLSQPEADDRRYAGATSFGLHSYWAPGPDLEARAGIDLVAIGPQTGLARFQDWVHDQISSPSVGQGVRDDQIGDRIVPTLSGEIGSSYRLGGADLHPFVEGRAGDETLLRLGADLSFGSTERGALWARDTGTGQRYVAVSGQSVPGTQFVLGADIAYVADSIYLPESGAAGLEDTRYRLRAGITSRSENFGVFYGVTWLSPEFDTQPDGQLLGSLRLRFNF